MSLNNLADLYEKRHRVRRGPAALRARAHDLGRRAGPDHPDVAHSLNNLAGVCVKQRRYADAQPLYERALAIWERSPTPDHPDGVEVLVGLATCIRSKSAMLKQSRSSSAPGLSGNARSTTIIPKLLEIQEHAQRPARRGVAN